MNNLEAIGASYFIALMDATGRPLKDIDDFLSLTYTRTLNGIGTLELILSADFPNELLKVDGRIGVYRTVRTNQTYLDTGTIYMIRAIRRRIDTITIQAFTPLFIFGDVSGMSGRYVAYDSGTSETDKSGASDDMIKQIVREASTNIAAGRDVTTAVNGVDISAYLTVESNKGEGASIDKGFARRNVLRVIQQISEATVTSTPRIYFDIVAPTPDTLEFRTYKNLVGTDRSTTSAVPTIFSDQDGSLTDVELTEDYSNEWTSAIVGGRGEGASRITANNQDTTRITVSPFGYRERFKNASYVVATGGTATNQLNSEAESLLRQGRPRVIFTGKIVDVPQRQYGVHWFWGDKVGVNSFGGGFDAIIESVMVSVSGGRENVDAYLRAELS